MSYVANPYAPSSSSSSSDDEVDERYPLRVKPGTRLTLGINKYSHDASICAADTKTGQVLFAMSKERIDRKKHSGGNVATLVERTLDELGLTLDDVDLAVMNNHHHRILDPESGEERSGGEIAIWEEGLNMNGGGEDGFGDDENLLSGINKVRELGVKSEEF